MRFDILTLFPEMFPGYLGQSVLKRALERGLLEVHLHDMRRWASGKHQQMDDRPFGGGPGMVLMVEPVVAAVEAVRAMGPTPGRLIMLSPQGRQLRQEWAETVVSERRLVLLCGRYEGFDERIRDILAPEEVSLGDFILSGGELPAMIVLDAVARMVPGVLGDEQSNRDDSFSSGVNLLEAPQYTRPREYRGLAVPEVLLSGDHGRVAEWRVEQRKRRTQQRRPDLWDEYQNEQTDQ